MSEKLAMADLQQIIQTSFQVIEFMEIGNKLHVHFFKDLKDFSPVLILRGVLVFYFDFDFQMIAACISYPYAGSPNADIGSRKHRC